MQAREFFNAFATPSICSAHPAVLNRLMQSAKGRTILIESTCNQVNQFGGYTGMTPELFMDFLHQMCVRNQLDFSNIIVGGDHLGPSPWQHESAKIAMQKAVDLVQSYVKAGYQKIHLDCSMPLVGDEPQRLEIELIAKRTATLALAAEQTITQFSSTIKPVYVIGSEVPTPGGASSHASNLEITQIAVVEETLDAHQQAFFEFGLQDAWERVIAVVVQPGVEFGDDFTLAYDCNKTNDLTEFIKSQNLVYEAHSTDYQTSTALRQMAEDQFAILKVGPELTFAYREAIFALTYIEEQLYQKEERSNLLEILDETMLKDPRHWKKHYSGTMPEQAFKRKFSLSDRVRYYWNDPTVQQALTCLFQNLSSHALPVSLLSQFAQKEKEFMDEQQLHYTPLNVLNSRISFVLNKYWQACAESD